MIVIEMMPENLWLVLLLLLATSELDSNNDVNGDDNGLVVAVLVVVSYYWDDYGCDYCGSSGDIVSLFVFVATFTSPGTAAVGLIVSLN